MIVLCLCLAKSWTDVSVCGGWVCVINLFVGVYCQNDYDNILKDAKLRKKTWFKITLNHILTTKSI